MTGRKRACSEEMGNDYEARLLLSHSGRPAQINAEGTARPPTGLNVTERTLLQNARVVA